MKNLLEFSNENPALVSKQAMFLGLKISVMANSSEKASTLMPVFQGVDYNTWKVKMRTYLMSEGLWSMVVTGYQEPEDESSFESAEKKKLESDRMVNAKALTRLQNGVSPEIFPRIIRCEYAKDAWEIIANEFGSDEKTSVMKLQNLRREFENVQMKENEDFGEEMNDQKFMQKMLISLPERYDIVVAVFEPKDLFILKPEELVNALESHENRRQKRGDSN
ncbi:uncharacterized protein LOC120010593 [Tripterygium wilfordii]|uniref:uncharacterized protein LOC120010593 n=1 Tax=Tripterygium wilfordii TaxID=458696 RepID=UPI0018F8022A|nr:uncharacterized protein LOC120010593 [Tripterygium wilfordii]